MPYVLTYESRFTTEDIWINTSCKYDYISLFFILQYYACQYNKQYTRFLNETKNENHPLPLELSTASYSLKVALRSSLWELRTFKMEPRHHIKYGPFQYPGWRTVKSKPLYKWRSVIQTDRQAVRLGIEPLVGFITCLNGVRFCPLSAVTVSVGCVCTLTNNLHLHYLQCLVVFPMRNKCAVNRTTVIADHALT